MRDSDIQRRDQSRAMTQQRSGEQGDWQGYVQPYRYYGPGYRGVGYYAVFYQGPNETSDTGQPDTDEQATQFDQRNVHYGQGQESGWGWQGRRRSGRGGWEERSGAWGDRARQFGQFAGRGPKGYQRSDERLREDVSDRLMEHPELDASGLEVHVKDGVVTLKGDVDSRWAKRLAEDIAEDVPGVRDVMNQLSVDSAFSGEMGSESGGGMRTTRGTSQTGPSSQARDTTPATTSASQPRNGRRSTATAER